VSTRLKTVPYFSQWESREITNDVLARGPAVALAQDPKWACSGANTVEEYVQWAGNLCGMACLKMILAARTGRAISMLELSRRCAQYGGYTVSPAGQIKGLVYAPFVTFIRDEYSLDAEVVTGITADGIARVLQEAEFFIASVHHSIRWPDREPPTKGGHLVLVFEAAEDVVFHNPSGHNVSAQEYASVPAPIFNKFFAGRGVAIKAKSEPPKGSVL
jgi:Peptidase_C39 like family